MQHSSMVVDFNILFSWLLWNWTQVKYTLVSFINNSTHHTKPLDHSFHTPIKGCGSSFNEMFTLFHYKVFKHCENKQRNWLFVLSMFWENLGIAAMKDSPSSNSFPLQVSAPVIFYKEKINTFCLDRSQKMLFEGTWNWELWRSYTYLPKY